MKQLNDSEWQIVVICRSHSFAAYLQAAWLHYPKIIRNIAVSIYPTKEELEKVNEKMWLKWGSFEHIYGWLLAEKIGIVSHPLQIEQQAWKLLSPLVRKHCEEFKNFLQSYSPETANADQLLIYINSWWDLLQKWNIISKSYGSKYNKDWKYIESTEEEVRGLIAELSK